LPKGDKRVLPGFITTDDQRAKLELVVATADAIWGGVDG